MTLYRGRQCPSGRLCLSLCRALGWPRGVCLDRTTCFCWRFLLVDGLKSVSAQVQRTILCRSKLAVNDVLRR
ncbi:hypothetical protein EVAR_50479_1 [Eumeta japonica]|uniref:Uncharacterized protein n=1 Tax=Eumeta variegata TaxID=151549 RepID=A0A4C1XVL4_EUMVA|nr:hypothetical protein EVAR_50479_1 [Eumeta japonica]